MVNHAYEEVIRAGLIDAIRQNTTKDDAFETIAGKFCLYEHQLIISRIDRETVRERIEQAFPCPSKGCDGCSQCRKIQDLLEELGC